MNIQLERLSKINIDEMIALNTNERVLKQMPLAEGSTFDEAACIAWVKGKEQQWEENGYGPWAIMINEKFAGWGGFQKEEGDADLALVLHPQYWGFGKQIFDKMIQKAFGEMGFDSITILLPPSRTKLKGIYALGFEQDGEMTYDGVRFIRYRLQKTNVDIIR